MDNKEKYYKALIADNGNHDEISLGASLNVDEETTRKIISMLLAEYKIEYSLNGACNYRIMRKSNILI
jgi:hypothetical protein